jgi:hypothetical protein
VKNAQVILQFEARERFTETPFSLCIARPTTTCYSDLQDKVSLVMRKVFSQTFEIIGGFFFEVTVAYSDSIFLNP